MASVTISLNPLLIPILTAKQRFIVVEGGRGSGKSIGLADITIMKAEQGLSCLCGREFQNSIDDSVLSLLESRIEKHGLPGWSKSNNKLHHRSGGQIAFKGLARNPSAIKSINDVDWFWGEEAQTFSDETLRQLTPSIRAEGSQLAFTANLNSSEDAFSQKFIERPDDPELIYRVKMNYSDNPLFPDELEQERRDDFKNLPRALYDHIWLGAYNDSVENSIILAEWFDACIDSHKKLGFEARGQIVCSHDPADTGDARATMIRHGNVILDIDETTELDINQACRWSLEHARAKSADTYIYDASGVGLALKGEINAYFNGTHTKVEAFKGGASVENPNDVCEQTDTRSIYNKDAYRNLRAQCYARLRDRCYKTYLAVTQNKYINPDELISFSSNIGIMPKFKAELCRIPQVYNTAGMFQVMRKDQMMSKLKIKSPNLADCAMMSEISLKSFQSGFDAPLKMPRLNIA